jgi:hypothetical protein
MKAYHVIAKMNAMKAAGGGIPGIKRKRRKISPKTATTRSDRKKKGYTFVRLAI